MSGGQWNYVNDHLANDMFDWMSPDYGKSGFEQAAKARRINPMQDRLISELVWDVLCLIHSCDYYLSCDTSEETYKADVKYFKDKWLKNGMPKAAVKQIVDGDIAMLQKELYEAFGLEEQMEVLNKTKEAK